MGPASNPPITTATQRCIDWIVRQLHPKSRDTISDEGYDRYLLL